MVLAVWPHHFWMCFSPLERCWPMPSCPASSACTPSPYLQAQAARADGVSMKNYGWVWGEGNQKEYRCGAKNVPASCAWLVMGWPKTNRKAVMKLYNYISTEFPFLVGQADKNYKAVINFTVTCFHKTPLFMGRNKGTCKAVINFTVTLFYKSTFLMGQTSPTVKLITFLKNTNYFFLRT